MHERMRRDLDFAVASIKENKLHELKNLVLRTPVEDVGESVDVLIETIRRLQGALDEERRRTNDQMRLTVQARKAASTWRSRALRCNDALKEIKAQADVPLTDVSESFFADVDYYIWLDVFPWEED